LTVRRDVPAMMRIPFDGVAGVMRHIPVGHLQDDAVSPGWCIDKCQGRLLRP
jgi:hypothetical protein